MITLENDLFVITNIQVFLTADLLIIVGNIIASALNMAGATWALSLNIWKTFDRLCWSWETFVIWTF